MKEKRQSNSASMEREKNKMNIIIELYNNTLIYFVHWKKNTYKLLAAHDKAWMFEEKLPEILFYALNELRTISWPFSMKIYTYITLLNKLKQKLCLSLWFLPLKFQIRKKIIICSFFNNIDLNNNIFNGLNICSNM